MRHISYSIIVFSALCIGAIRGQQHQYFSTPHSEEGWLAKWEHRHMSPRGTPYIHAFSVEPAYLGRELIVDYLITEFDGETEQAVEVELEWATRSTTSSRSAQATSFLSAVRRTSMTR